MHWKGSLTNWTSFPSLHLILIFLSSQWSTLMECFLAITGQGSWGRILIGIFIQLRKRFSPKLESFKNWLKMLSLVKGLNICLICMGTLRREISSPMEINKKLVLLDLLLLISSPNSFQSKYPPSNTLSAFLGKPKKRKILLEFI